MFDLHHIPNKKSASKFIFDYDYLNAVSIALPYSEHKAIKYDRNLIHKSARSLLAYELSLLRKFTNIPSEVLLHIVYLNKLKYQCFNQK